MPVGNFVFIRLTEVRRAVVTEGMTIPQAGLDPGVHVMERASQLLPCLHCLLTVGATQPGTSPSTFVPSDFCSVFYYSKRKGGQEPTGAHTQPAAFKANRPELHRLFSVNILRERSWESGVGF